ncbi:MAG: hypothetical protein ACFFAN_20220, partial [Promethearchaeota archaeon]
FGLFTLIITLFGGIFIFSFQKRSKERWKLTKLEYLFLSYSIGLSLYVVISYILDIFIFFNFYSAYLPYLIIDSIFLLYLYKSKVLREFFFKIKVIIKREYKYLIKIISIFLIISIIQFIFFWDKLIYKNSLVGYDSYLWTGHVLYVLEYGHFIYLDYRYPAGFAFFCAGNLLIISDLNFVYYFMKFACLPFLTLYLFVMLIISQKIFKKCYLIFFCLISVLSYSYFLHRTIAFYPSLIANLLILISLIIIITNAKNYLIGFIIPAVFLIHPISALFFIIALLIFYYIKIIKSILKHKNTLSLVKEIFFICLFTIIFLIPYFIATYIEKGEISIIFTYFLKKPTEDNSSNIKFQDVSFLTSFLLIFNENLLDLISINEISSLFYLTLGPFLIFSIGGFFFNNNDEFDFDKDFIEFLRIGLILIFLFFYIPHIFEPDLTELHNFIYILKYRVLETFCGHIVILAALFLNFTFDLSDKLWQSLKRKNNKIRNFSLNHNLAEKLINIKAILILTLISSAFVFNLSRKDFYYQYAYPDHFVESIQYIKEECPKNSDIAVYKFKKYYYNKIYFLLYNYEINYFNFDNQKDLSFDEFYDFIESNDIDFLILGTDRYSRTFLETLSNNSSFIELEIFKADQSSNSNDEYSYDSDEYIVYKIRI